MQVGKMKWVEGFSCIGKHRHWIRVRHAVEGTTGRETHPDSIATPNTDYCCCDFQQKPSPILYGATILICAVVAAISQKLIDQVTIGSMNFYSIKPSL